MAAPNSLSSSSRWGPVAPLTKVEPSQTPQPLPLSFPSKGAPLHQASLPEISPTDRDIMMRFKLSIQTMHTILAIPPKPTIETVLRRAAGASELRSYSIKQGERSFFLTINELPQILWPLKEYFRHPWQKVFLLVQIDLSGAEYPNRLSASLMRELMQERVKIMGVLVKIVRAVVELLANRRDAVGDGQQAQLLQVEGIGKVRAEKLVRAGIRTVHQLADKEFYHIERLLSRNPPFGQNLVNKLVHFPRLMLDSSVIGHEIAGRRGNSPAAIVRVILGCSNGKRPPEWRGKIPWVTFMLENWDGSLAYFWRGSMKSLMEEPGKVLTFRVDLAGGEATAYFSCEEIVGTMVRATLRDITTDR